MLTGLLLVFVWRTRWPRAIKQLVSIIGVTFCLALGAARVGVGAHWPSDVLGGFLCAGVIVGFSALGVSLVGSRDARAGRATLRHREAR